MKATPQMDPETNGQDTAVSDNTSQLVLPYLATAVDLREVVQFLKRKPEGASIAEAMDAVRKRLFDPRKVFAYEFWGIVEREDDRLRLSQLGWEFAEKLMPEAEAYRSVLARTPLYDSALAWIYEQGHQLVTYFDMATAWCEIVAEVETQDVEKLESYAASFFHLCHAADIGMLTVGRKGQPTRLSIYPEELENYIKRAAQERELRAGRHPEILQVFRPGLRQSTSKVKTADTPRVLLSLNRDATTVDHILEMLELSGLDYEIIERKTTGIAPLSDQTFQAMRRCNFGVFSLSEQDFDETEAGGTINCVLMELGAAFVHFDRRVILLVKGSPPLPVNFQDLHAVKYETDVTWEVAVQVIKMIKDISY